MTNALCIDEKYSTTKLVTKEKPSIENGVEDKFETVLFLPEGENRKGEGGLRTKGYFKKSYEGKPLVSIVTVVFNGEKYLEETIKSVIDQDYEGIEYIVIDGGSTDNTVNIIQKYEQHIDYWASEPDNGIYDAMNKGINIAKGNGLLFLNAGDCFRGRVISDKITIPCFLNVKYYNAFDSLVDIKIKNYKLGIPNCHQGIVFENRGIKYNLDYTIASDYDFYLKHDYTKLPIMPTSGYVYYDNEGFSKINLLERDKEIQNIINNNFGIFYVIYFSMKGKLKNIIRKFI